MFEAQPKAMRWLGVLLAAGLCVACGGGGGGDGAGTDPGGGGGGAGGGGSGDPNPPAGSVFVSGVVSFDLVPALAGLGGGLDYANTEVAPARGVTVEIISAANQVLATTGTDANGAYSVAVAEDSDVYVRAKAEMLRTGTPSWTFRVLDNTNSDALYALDGALFNTGTANVTADLHAPSGWDDSSSSYAEPRSAAPFAILDTVFDAAAFVLTAASSTEFPALDLHWSPDNVPNFSADGSPDIASGEIGSSFYSAGLGGIYLVGAEDEDTEEYDRHVIVHEWGHYIEDSFSRADNIGGPHGLRDQLDLRVAFGEGWGNALSAMVTGDSVYRDVQGTGQGSAGSFDVEGAHFLNPNPDPGWYSEESVQEILYDLFDANQDTVEDNLALGFAPLFGVLTNQQRLTDGLTSVFSFVAALKSDLPADAAGIDAIVGTQSIDGVVDEYGTGETNSAGSADVLPIYRDIAVNGGAVNVCSTNEFESANTGSVNKLGSRQFLKFSVGATGVHTLRAQATDVPAGESADPDMILHRRGWFGESTGAPTAECEVTPLLCAETYTRSLDPGDYVLEVYEWTNTEPEDSDYPPIGRTCFDVEITR